MLIKISYIFFSISFLVLLIISIKLFKYKKTIFKIDYLKNIYII